MYDRTMLLELFLEIEEAIRRIERRFSGINSPEDFLRDDNGLDRLDGIAMMLVAIGENINRIEKMISKKAFDQHIDIEWGNIMGMRNILAHDCFSIDAFEVYQICSSEIGYLKEAMQKIRNDAF
ncbi:HepT-like ribonuclease domain-containing protein [Pseudanabaena minima]|uniref:HepT-like ribonuclease domain-containing protein n=1 Tax=Pseudanabaena minima TaxID=890415 RepID=UPI003DA8A63C